jgi:hypothetical protein
MRFVNPIARAGWSYPRDYPDKKQSEDQARAWVRIRDASRTIYAVDRVATRPCPISSFEIAYFLFLSSSKTAYFPPFFLLFLGSNTAKTAHNNGKRSPRASSVKASCSGPRFDFKMPKKSQSLKITGSVWVRT